MVKFVRVAVLAALVGVLDFALASPTALEIRSNSDPKHCGSSGKRCSAPSHGIATCHDGHCGYYCIEYYAKYDGYCKSVGSDPKNCGKIGHKCYVPSHGHATCSKGVCGVTCIHGYHPDEDNDYCVKNGPTKSPLPPIERERVKRSIDEFEQQVLGIMNPPVILQSPCKQDEQACHLLRADGTSSTTFECVNIMSDVFSCGKCQTPQRDEDCTRLPNIQSARCHMGQCKVSSCLPGFTQVNSTACVPI